MLQRNLLGNISVSFLAIVMVLLLLKPGTQGAFDTASIMVEDNFKEWIIDGRKILAVDDISSQKKIDFVESMIEHTNVFIDETKMKLYQVIISPLLLVTVVFFLILSGGQYKNLKAFLRYIRSNYPKPVQRTAVNTLNTNRSLLFYFSAFRSLPLIIAPAIFFYLCVHLHTAIEIVFEPAYEYQSFLIKERLVLETKGVAVIPLETIKPLILEK